MSDWREVHIPGAADPTMQHLCNTRAVTRQWRSAILVRGVWHCPHCQAERAYRPAIVLAKEVQQ